MNRNGLGSKRAKSISSTQAGKRRVADVGPDRIIRHFGASDIKGWYDATQPELSILANNADVSAWFDKSADQTNMCQGETANKPHYIHQGLNGRPILRGDGSNHVMSSSSGGANSPAARGAVKDIDWGAACSAFVLVKTANDENNHGIYGGESGGTVPKSRFGFGSKQNEANPDQLRVEVFGRVADGGGQTNFQVDNFYNMTGSTGMPTCRNQFSLYYLEYQINGGQSGASAAFTRSGYKKDAVSPIALTSEGTFAPAAVDASEATTMANKGFDSDHMMIFKNIHSSMGNLDGDLGFLMFSNRHYSLKERQMILKAIQQIYGYADIN
jgi:hypothetical protein